jgi:crotonobetainyl-CoA:carnitine CoA-transferase CaiB-like acyl-CoA transferase
MLAFGILAALMMRGQDGQGRTVRSSQLRSMLWLANYNFAAALNLAETFPPFNQEAVYNPLLNLYKCSDGKWVTAGVAEADKYWDLFCNTIGAPHLSTDPTLRTLEDRYAKRKELIAELSKIFATRTRDEWLTELRSAGLWAGPVFTVDEVIDDEHVQAEGSFKTYSNGTRLVTPPFDIEGWSPPVTSAPEFGGSTDEVLRSLGISEDELSRLRIDGVIW